MKVTVLQQDIVFGDIAANRKNMRRLLAESPKSDIYIFPEMCTTGFSLSPIGLAEEHGSETLQLLKSWAVEYDAAIVATILTTENGLFYNRMYFVTPDGAVGSYDKIHLFEYSGEDKIFVGGTEKVTWEWRGLRIRAAICYDLRFPLTLHNNDGYDLLVISANFPNSRILSWDTLVRARAIENQCYVAASNRVGVDEFGSYVGHSAIINPYGRTMASCVDDCEGHATAEVDWEMIEKIRKSHHLIQDKVR